MKQVVPLVLLALALFAGKAEWRARSYLVSNWLLALGFGFELFVFGRDRGPGTTAVAPNPRDPPPFSGRATITRRGRPDPRSSLCFKVVRQEPGVHGGDGFVSGPRHRR